MKRYILGFFTAAAGGSGTVAAAPDVPCPLTALLTPVNRQPLGNGEAAVLAVSAGGAGDLADDPGEAGAGRALPAAGRPCPCA